MNSVKTIRAARVAASIVASVAAAGGCVFGVPAALAAVPSLPAPPAACEAALVLGGPLDAGDDLHLGRADNHFRPGAPDSSSQTFVYGDAGSDCLEGGPAYDLLNGGTGDDWLVGGNGPDQLVGGAGNDTLLTGRGDDRSATSGGESASGGGGDDTVLPGPGDTRITLGSGDDRVVGTDGTGGEILCGPGEDTVVADALDTLSDCEHVTRVPAPATRQKHEAGGVTLRFRSPWARRPADGLISFFATITRPEGARCGGLSQEIATRGQDVVVRLRPGREFRPCAGRWTVSVSATFEDDPNSECDGGGCGITSADVTPERAFRLR